MNESELRPEELQVLENARFFDLKAQLDAKINQLFSDLKPRIEERTRAVHANVPPELLRTAGRTFRGENHHGYPWRALDVPRFSQSGDLFIFRTLLLWGHHFSVHLILNGHWKSQLVPRLGGASAAWQVDPREDPWIWFPPQPQGWPANALSPAQLQLLLSPARPFKMSVYFPLTDFSSIPDHATQCWSSLLPLLFPAQSPSS